MCRSRSRSANTGKCFLDTRSQDLRVEVHRSEGSEAAMRTPVFLALALLVACSHSLPGPQLVDLVRIDDSIAIDMRYAGEDNFVGSRIDGSSA